MNIQTICFDIITMPNSPLGYFARVVHKRPEVFRGDQICMMLRIESATPAVNKQDIISAELKSGSGHIQYSCSKPESENGVQHDSADPNPWRTVHGDTDMRESEAFHKDLGGATEQSNSQRGTWTSVHTQEEVPRQQSGSLHMPAGLFAAESDRAAAVGTCSAAGQPRLPTGRNNYAPQVLETAERNYFMERNPSIPVQYHRQSSNACQPSDLEPQRPSIPPSMPKPLRQGRCHSTTGDHLLASKPGPPVEPLPSGMHIQCVHQTPVYAVAVAIYSQSMSIYPHHGIELRNALGSDFGRYECCSPTARGAIWWKPGSGHKCGRPLHSN